MKRCCTEAVNSSFKICLTQILKTVTVLVFLYVRVVHLVKVDVCLLLDDTSYNEQILNQTMYETKNMFPVLSTVDVTLTLTSINSSSDVSEILKQYSNTDLDIFLADLNDKYVPLLGLLASEYNKPTILTNGFLPYKLSHHVLSLYNGFDATSSAIIEYLEWFQWANVAIISTDDVFWQQMVPVIESNLFQDQFNVRRSFMITDLSDSSAILRVLNDILSDVKAIVLLMDAADALSLMSIAGTWNSKHIHDFFLISRTPYFDFGVLTSNVSLLDSHSYLFVMTPSVPSSVETELNTTLFLRLEDAFVCLFSGLNSSYDSPSDHLDVENFIPNIISTPFRGLNKTFVFAADGERNFDYGLYQFNAQSRSFEMSLLIQRNSAANTWKRLVVHSLRGVVLPDDCFKGRNCGTDNGLDFSVIIAVSLGVAVLAGIVSFVSVVLWRKKAKINLTKGPNKILLEMDDLTFLQKKTAKSTKMLNGTLLDKPDLVKTSEKSNRSLASLHELSEFSQYARYKGDIVYVKEVKVKGIEVKGKLLTYIRTLREIRHENVNPIYGFLIDPLRSAMVSEYCNRGSLMDVLNNKDIKLDWDFKTSLLTDLVRGLRFIQSSPIHYHGNLKSRNCVIDSRWVLKLTDFGMPRFRERAKMTISYEPRDLLWTAPEHLRDPYPGIKGSDKGDMYSMAIIMQEVILRKEPFGMVDLKPSEIIQKIRNPPPLLRPSVSPQAAQPQYIQMMKESWAENPELRPTIEDVYQQFKHIAGGKKMNIVDSMFRMLEKYSNDLEDIVKERTVQLEEEKMKTDMLLYRMLPATVAESLKLGKAVEAVSYSEVTIYFSDIVGFTTISAMSTPMQVVGLLNDLYTMFDATINNYDVYKVETIGDAYMVVSGLPVPNTRNAGEIGTMALDLLSQCGTFTISHMPEVPLRLRIGLHTGSCVAGVVGLTMPRFCLFGDTVNTASRMESTGAAFRVHISSETKMKLDELGGYKTEYRGKVELKGKGQADTYWLIGKEGFRKPLPAPPPLAELDAVYCMRKQSDSNTSLSDATERRLSLAPESAKKSESPVPKGKGESKNQKNNSSHESHGKQTQSTTIGAVDNPERKISQIKVAESAKKAESPQNVSKGKGEGRNQKYNHTSSSSEPHGKQSVISIQSVDIVSASDITMVTHREDCSENGSNSLSPVHEVS